ncbi:MAG: LLM class F420-dependent oxidoreductase [Micromonosporaceae bacterium]|nr:LLM class F420-dependent oxidoreductase [Micromonosporaceae bacterium]
MEIGVVFPQTEIGADPAAVQAYAAAVEELGYQHILAFDHVLGADPSVHKGWNAPYDVDSTFHEPFVLFGYLAAITSVELVAGVIVLPQRQTALVAKQAAEVDVLSQGRLRLGVGLGWNQVEYEALGKDFTNRGRRIGEQVQLLRLLWTQRSVTFHGEYETVTGAGLAPLPVQRPIPIWFGAQSLPAYQRAGQLGDGWFPQMQPGPALDEAAKVVRSAARAAGRNPSTVGMHGRTRLNRGVDATAEAVRLWRASGATHLSIDTMGLEPGGPVSVDRHIAALAEFADAISLPRRPAG